MLYFILFHKQNKQMNLKLCKLVKIFSNKFIGLSVLAQDSTLAEKMFRRDTRRQNCNDSWATDGWKSVLKSPLLP